MPDPDPLIPKHGGYRKLKSYQIARLVYDVTVRFCDRFIRPRSRTYDQMIQAARSGVQNIAEGSEASGTSRKTELKLTSVARASLEELRLDYEDYLRQRKLAQWTAGEALRQELIDRRCATADDVARWVKEVHERQESGKSGPARPARQSRGGPSGRSGLSGRCGQERTAPPPAGSGSPPAFSYIAGLSGPSLAGPTPSTRSAKSAGPAGSTPSTPSTKSTKSTSSTKSTGSLKPTSSTKPAPPPPSSPTPSPHPGSPPPATIPALAANAALVLIAVASSLLDRQLTALSEALEKDGGFSERLYNRRKRRRESE